MGYQKNEISMSVRDKIYKQMIKEKDQLIKIEKHEKKRYIEIK